MPTVTLCSVCKGTGKGGTPENPVGTCDECGGSGEVFNSKQLTELIGKCNEILEGVNTLVEDLNP